MVQQSASVHGHAGLGVSDLAHDALAFVLMKNGCSLFGSLVMISGSITMTGTRLSTPARPTSPKLAIRIVVTATPRISLQLTSAPAIVVCPGAEDTSCCVSSTAWDRPPLIKKTSVADNAKTMRRDTSVPPPLSALISVSLVRSRSTCLAGFAEHVWLRFTVVQREKMLDIKTGCGLISS